MIFRSKEDKQAALHWCLLAAGPSGMTTVELSLVTGMWACTTYVHLYRLEKAGKAFMRFDPGPYPRTARYFAGREST